MAAFFDSHHIQQVLQSVNIVDVIGRYVALSRKGKEMVGLCPFHDDRRPSMTVSEAKQIFKCFSCGAGGDVFKFLMRRERMTFSEALTFLADQAGVVLPKQAGKADGGRRALEVANEWAAQLYRREFEEGQTGAQVREYVKQRGIDEATAQEFGLGWARASWDHLQRSAGQAGQNMTHLRQAGLLVDRETGGSYDRFRGRLMFPVTNAFGKVIGFGGRVLDGDEVKYVNSPESALFRKGEALYGLHLAKDAIVTSRTAVVVEGYLDCMMAHQFGVKNVVATLGTALTPEHARALSRYAQRIVLMFDADAAGQKAADRAIDIFFAQQIEVKLASLPKGMDPCDFLLDSGKEAFVERIEGATEALMHKWQRTREQVEQADTVAGRKEAVEIFLAAVARAAVHGNLDGVTRGFLLNYVSQLIGVSPQEVLKRVKQLGQRLGTNRGAPNTDSSQKSPLRQGSEKTYEEILEVLLNRPDLFPTVSEALAADEIGDGSLRAVGQVVWDYCGAEGRGQVGEILAGCEDVAICDLATDLASRGAARGNFEERLAGAMSDLEQRRLATERETIGGQVATAGAKYGADAATALLLEFQAKWQPDPRRPGG